MILLSGMPLPALIAIIVVAVLLVGGLVAMLVITLPISKAIYEDQFVKVTPEKWLRVCSDTTNEEQVIMWERGKAWAERNKEHMTEVSITNDGLKLVGEYYDFGSKKSALIIPGRAECLVYAYYFAMPYEKAGYNVLVIDQRARGFSEGKYDSVGAKEHRDSIKWMKTIGEQFGVEEWCIHGVCMGGQQAMIIANSEECPKNLTNIIVDGMFVNFRETFKNHCTYINKPTFPVTDEVMLYMKYKSGYDQWKLAPVKLVKKLQHRILFIYGRQDVFSVPKMSEKIFNNCASEHKKLVWFDKGAHSHLRINNEDEYDQTIVDFLADNQ